MKLWHTSRIGSEFSLEPDRPRDQRDILGVMIANHAHLDHNCLTRPCHELNVEQLIWRTNGLCLRNLPMTDATRILSSIESGDPSTSEELLPLVYDELRRLAVAKLALEKLVSCPT